ncbi:hypothetical protein ZWY2020_028544 [Hordeum vulgare]|nr:hypothetical protein ZWY2020_028544 [Hordeum vulgare]
MGPAHGGLEFSKGALLGLGIYAVDIMTKRSQGKYYIDNSRWGPEADSVQSGYRVPFGKIHVFIGKIGAPVHEPDPVTDIIEPARYVRPIKRQDRPRHFFAGFTQGIDSPDEPVIHGVTPVNSDEESSMGDTDSIYALREGQLGGLPEAAVSEEARGPHRQVTIYMAGAAPHQPNPAGNNEIAGSSKTPAQAIADLVVETAKLMAIVVTVENQETINSELTKRREDMAKIQRDIEEEAARMGRQQALITAETDRMNTKGWPLERHQRASDAIHQRRHYGRLPAYLNPARLFDSPHMPGVEPNRTWQAAPGGEPARPPPQSMETHATRFQTPWGHFSNPVDNMLSATRHLESLPIHGNSPAEVEARNAIQILKTTVLQQAQYSYSRERLHSTPQASHTRSRHDDPPAVTANTDA